ncbi:MAG TPA: hypothetical protein VGM46_12410 [Mesorhizobium sp.]|jgi:hypothetical protein
MMLRCAYTTPAGFIAGPKNRNFGLPHFIHIMATWVRDCGSASFQNLARQNLARDAGLFRKTPNHGLERA